MLSRWLLTRPQFLILDEPTRGIDVGAHAEIIRLIETLCADGLALLVISSELEELEGVGVELDAIASVVIGGTLLSGGVGTVLGTLFGVAIQGLIQTYINFDGTLSSWWTKIAIGILLFIFIALQRGLTVLWENRQSSPVTRVNIAQR